LFYLVLEIFVQNYSAFKARTNTFLSVKEILGYHRESKRYAAILDISWKTLICFSDFFLNRLSENLGDFSEKA